MKRKIKNWSIVALSLFILSALSVSCSSKDDDEAASTQDSFNYRYTITLNNVESNDYVSFVVVGSAANNEKTIWKVNGVEGAGEQSISLGKNEFMGTTKTYVIETIKPIKLATCGTQIINYGTDMSLSLKIEKDGKEMINVNQVLSGDGADFTKNYDF